MIITPLQGKREKRSQWKFRAQLNRVSPTMMSSGLLRWHASLYNSMTSDPRVFTAQPSAWGSRTSAPSAGVLRTALHGAQVLVNVKDCGAGGHCGYRVLAYYMYGNAERYDDVRRLVCDGLELEGCVCAACEGCYCFQAM